MKLQLQLFASTAAVLFSGLSGSVATSLRGVAITSDVDAADSSDYYYYPEVEDYDFDSADYYPESEEDYDFDDKDDEEEGSEGGKKHPNIHVNREDHSTHNRGCLIDCGNTSSSPKQSVKKTPPSRHVHMHMNVKRVMAHIINILWALPYDGMDMDMVVASVNELSCVFSPARPVLYCLWYNIVEKLET